MLLRNIKLVAIENLSENRLSLTHFEVAHSLFLNQGQT